MSNRVRHLFKTRLKTTHDMCYRLRYTLVFLFILTAVVSLPAQGTTSESASLREQFDAMVSGSNRYQQFRVVPQTELNAFIRAVTDTLNAHAAQTTELSSTIATQRENIERLNTTVSSLNDQIAQLEKEKDGIYLLGALVSKVTYNIILWTIILAALAGLVFFFLRSRLAVSVTQSLRDDKEELAEELATAKKRRLEVEQDLRRKLQDEINKRNR